MRLVRLPHLAVSWQDQLLHYHRHQRLKNRMDKSTSQVSWVPVSEEEAVELAKIRSLRDVDVKEWQLVNVTYPQTPSELDKDRKLSEKLDREEAEKGCFDLAVKNSLENMSATPKAKAQAKVFAGNIPFYVIFSCSKKPDLEGIHHGLWEEVQRKLPGGALIGSGAADCKKFDDLEAAKAYYRRRNRTKSPRAGIYLFRYPSAR